jgi:hypothetical protein
LRYAFVMGEDFEARVAKLEQAHKDLEDAMIIMAHLEKTAAERIKEHATFIAEEEEYRREQKKRDRELDQRIDKLVSGMGEWIRRTS